MFLLKYSGGASGPNARGVEFSNGILPLFYKLSKSFYTFFYVLV